MNDLVMLKISIQSALIGRITPEVRGVYVGIKNKKIYIYVVNNGELSDYWKDEIYEIGTDVIANFDEYYSIEEKLFRIDYPKIIDATGLVCVYKRFENLHYDSANDSTFCNLQNYT